ncbi:uncharacterized protein BDV17DRAFT_282939 [Aspergillus undulatus]|uniref:uncharacterized protein n=1 Tax=Aspergillus undulatus TaxID=1810928 RepID=UPI003CCD2CA3
MPKQETFHLHPAGWEDDPEEERFRISTLDYSTGLTYCTFALFPRLDEADNARVTDVSFGGHSVKKKNSTVRFTVQWLDAPEDSGMYPSFDEIEQGNFCSSVLRDHNEWSVPPMTHGEKPEAHPDVSPVSAAYKAKFIRGGLVIIMHHHHYVNDVMGWAGLTHQLAENCYAIANQTPFSPWDPACLDLSRLTKPEVPEESKIDGPPAPERHTDLASLHTTHSPLSSDAVTRLHAPIFNPVPEAPLFWSEAVDMRRRMHSPKVHLRIQHNVIAAALSTTASEVISSWPLHNLALYIRQVTNSVTQDALDDILTSISPIRDKTSLNIRMDSFSPMSILQTDHRAADITSANFGFEKPLGVNVIYPPRDPSPESDEGSEFSISYEIACKEDLITDQQRTKYFEYRGVDAVDTGGVKS